MLDLRFKKCLENQLPSSLHFSFRGDENNSGHFADEEIGSVSRHGLSRQTQGQNIGLLPAVAI